MPIEATPYQISIQYNGGYLCGGSIISKNWTLIAAHCVYSDPNAFIVHAGSARSQKPGSIHRVDKAIARDDYESEDNEGVDIALIHLEEDFIFDETRKPIGLYDENEEITMESIATISGWGLINETKYPDILNPICAMTEEGGKDSCSGDSGGPLVVDGRLAGVVLWGKVCPVPEKPDVYAEVAYFRNWIRANSVV